MKIILKITVFFLFMAILSACSKPILKIVVPSNSALSSYDRYVVIQDSYIRLYKYKDIESDVLFILRRSEIAQIQESSGSDENGFFWYRVSVSSDAFLTENKNDDTADAKDLQGWILLRLPIRVTSLESAKFISRDISKDILDDVLEDPLP